MPLLHRQTSSFESIPMAKFSTPHGNAQVLHCSTFNPLFSLLIKFDITRMTIKANCPMNLERFPMDTQVRM